MSTNTFEGAPGSFLRDKQLQEALQVPIELTYSEFLQLKSNKALVPDTLYKITDKGDDGYFLRSITKDMHAYHGTARLLTPRYYGTGLFEGNNWISYWNAEKSVQVGDLAIWPDNSGVSKRSQIQNDLVWRNKTGAIGTATDDTLDNTNWELMPRTLGSECYLLQIFSISLDGAIRPGLDDVD